MKIKKNKNIIVPNWMNNTLRWFFKRRSHQMKFFIENPNQVQQELLMNLIVKCENTVFGKKHCFKDIKNYEDFKEKIPLHTYEDFESYVEKCKEGMQNIFWYQPIKWFAKSSGTTQKNKSKYVPLSKQSIEKCHIKAGKDMICLYVKNNPKSKIFKGKSLKLGGTSAIYEDNDVYFGISEYENSDAYFGDLSAILMENLPFWADFSSAPCRKTALLSEWETKLDKIVKETVPKNITSLAGVPSWMLLLLRRVLEYTGKKNILEVWPNLEVYFHGGVNFAPYKNQYQKLLPSHNFKYYQVYNASEGFFAIQDRNNSEDMLLMLDYGIFYEFIPMENYKNVNSDTIPLEKVVLNKNYAMVITTNGGLWRYMIGDTIVFTSLSPYRIKVTGRTKSFINAFGEELIVSNTDAALEKTCKITQCEILDYTAAPIFMGDQKKGGHEWMIAFKIKPKSLKEFTKKLDDNLQKINSDYQAKRNTKTLQLPLIHMVSQNLFYNWLKKHNKLGGQHKIPRLCNHRNFIEELLKEM